MSKRRDHIGEILEYTIRGHSKAHIAKLTGLTEKSVSSYQSSFKSDYLSYLSSTGITSSNNEVVVVEDYNKEFLDLISKIDNSLTNEEMLYCNLCVSTGNSVQAIKESGLDVGLPTSSTKEVYHRAILLRSEFLKRKRNVQEEIRRQQKERLEALDLDKDKVLTMHMSYLETLVEEGDPKNKGYIVKLMDQVAKITGSYTHVIQSSELSADDVLDSIQAILDEGLPDDLQEIVDENLK